MKSAVVCLAVATLVAADATSRFFVTTTASTLVERGLAGPAPADMANFQEVPAPGIRFVPNEAQATTAPWIDSNSWRFRRGLRKANYSKLPPGSAPLAAAEAYTYDVHAILNPDPADVEDLARMLQFLKALEQPAMTPMANIAVVDDGSPQMSEILNLLTRRNLLYKVVSAPDRSLDVTAQLGTSEFPKEAAANPSEFAARVRAKLGDDKRLVRLYGTSTTIAHLTGDGKRARLHLLSFGGRGRQQRQQAARPPLQHGIRVRVLGRYRPTRVAAFGAEPGAKLEDVENPGDATEFTMPAFTTTAIVDLDPVK